MLVEELHRVAPHLVAPPVGVAGVVQVGGHRRVGQHVAEVGHALGRLLPVLQRHHMAHVGPGVEGLDEGRQRDRRALPSELRHVLLQPDLEGLRGHRLDVLDHRAPACVTRQDLAAHEGDDADADAQHHEVEVAPDLQRGRGHAAAVPMRLEGAAFGLQPCAVDKLCRVGRGGPARQALDVDERLVLAAAANLGLDVEFEPLHVGLLARGQRGLGSELHVLQAVEEADLHAALLEHLVAGREHDVAHAGLHLPEHRAAVGEEHPQRAAQCLAGGQPWTCRVAVLVRQCQVVQAAHEGRIERALGRAVHAQPLAALEVVDGLQAAWRQQQAVAHRADQDRQHEVDDLPLAAHLVVGADDVLELLAHDAGHRVQQAQRHVLAETG